MNNNTFGEIFRVTTWGESHGPAIGAVIDGCPPGIPITEDYIQVELDKRKPGQSHVTTQRGEPDAVEIYSGVFEGLSTGAPICLIIHNQDQKSKDYSTIKDLFRPGHADYTFQKKYGIRDYKGGGRSSGRETACRVAAGAIAKKILNNSGIKIYAYTIQIGHIKSSTFDPHCIWQNVVRAADLKASNLMEKAILEARSEEDSLGGIVEVRAENLPIGLGDPVFNKIEAMLGYGILSIGAVKGIEFGEGFRLASMKGSESNDAFTKENGKVVTKTNNAGGTLGGISNGMPLVARVAVKPTSSLSRSQDTVNINEDISTIETKGRHDPCIVPRIVPVIEAMTALVIIDRLLFQSTIKPFSEGIAGKPFLDKTL